MNWGNLVLDKPSLKEEILSEQAGCRSERLSSYDKRQMQYLLRAKLGSYKAGWAIMSAEAVVKKAFERKENTCIGWSGGMCSTVILDMALNHDPDVTVLYSNTGVEFPENVKYVHKIAKEWALNLVELIPETTYWKVKDEKGWPQIRTQDTREPACCEALKYKPRREFFKKEHIKINLTGLRASESDMRVNHAVRFGQIYDVKHGAMTVYQPILYWGPQEVEAYFRLNNIPRNDVYKTQERNGCWCCPAHNGWEDSVFNWSPCAYQWLCKQMCIKPQSRLLPFNMSEVEKK